MKEQNQAVDVGSVVYLNKGKTQKGGRRRQKKSCFADLRVQVIKNELQMITSDLAGNKRLMRILTSEVMGVCTEVERGLLCDMMKNTRSQLDVLENKFQRLQKVLSSIEDNTPCSPTLLTPDEVSYLKGVKLKRGRKPKAAKHGMVFMGGARNT